MALRVTSDCLSVSIVLQGCLICIILWLWLSIFLLVGTISIVRLGSILSGILLDILLGILWCDGLISRVVVRNIIAWILISIERHIVARLWSSPLVRSGVDVALRLMISVGWLFIIIGWLLIIIGWLLIVVGWLLVPI